MLLIGYFLHFGWFVDYYDCGTNLLFVGEYVRVVMRVILGRVLVLCLEVWFVCIMSSVSVVIEV